MASRIQGITVEIGGDTTKLQNALKGVNGQVKSTQSQLKDVNKLLKLDPSNTELLAQKHKLLAEAVGETKEKLATLKTAAKQANTALANGEISKEQYDALQREIIETEQNLKNLETQANQSATAVQKIAASGEKLKTVRNNISSAGQKLLPVTGAVAGLGTAAVTTAANFESSMSQVQATMEITKDSMSTVDGQSVNTMDTLSKLAKKMGAETAFSASECAGALNYLALAGYDTQQMCDTLPTVLNLVAAGDIALADASDMVTDAIESYARAKIIRYWCFFEVQNMNTLNEGGELLLMVYAAFAQGESETYRELAQMTFKRKFSEGRPEYQLRKTLGFDMTENNEIQIVPKEAEGVKQIFQWVKENYSTQTIVKMAAAKGITLKSGKPFTAQWVYKTVRNVAYKGDYIMQRTYTYSERKVHVNQTLVPSFYIENDHEAIVSKRLWNAANKVIDDRAKERTTHLEMKPLTEENYPYIHKLHCAKCGGVLYGQKTKSGAQYSFSCGRRNRQGKGFCSGVSVPQKVIESWGEIDGNIYISFDPDKPLHKQHSYVKESTWKKKHTKKKLPPLPAYNVENYPYYRRVYCAECGHLLTRSRRYDGLVEFICNGMASRGKSYCKGVRVPEEVLNRLPEWDGFYWIKEDRENGEKHYSYTCKEEKP